MFKLHRCCNPASEIVFVGAEVIYAVFDGTSTYYDIPLDALTGGIASAPSPGDLIVVWNHNAIGSTVDLNMTAVADGTGAAYTEIADLYCDSNVKTNAGAHYRVQGATPDAFVRCNRREYNYMGGLAMALVFRGVDQSTPLDVAPTTVTGTTGTPNPPAITPVTPGACVLILGAAAEHYVAEHDLTGPSGYSELAKGHSAYAYSSDKPIASAIAAWKLWAGSGAEDPGAFGGGSANTQHTHAAVTLALRPAT